MITTADLVKRLAELGQTRSGRTLLNDARAGRIDRPKQKPRLGYPGSETMWPEHVIEQVLAFTRIGDGLVIDDRIVAAWLRDGSVPPGFRSSEVFISDRFATFLADMKKAASDAPNGLAGFLNGSSLSFDKAERDESEGDRIDTFHNAVESALNDSTLLKHFPLLRGLAERAIHAGCIAEVSDNVIDDTDRFSNFMGSKELAVLSKIMRLIRSSSNFHSLGMTEIEDARELIFTLLSCMSAMGAVAERFERFVESLTPERVPYSVRSVMRLLEAVGSIPRIAIGSSPIIVGALALFMHEDKAFARQVKALIAPLKVLSAFALIVIALKKREPLQPT